MDSIYIPIMGELVIIDCDETTVEIDDAKTLSIGSSRQKIRLSASANRNLNNRQKSKAADMRLQCRGLVGEIVGVKGSLLRVSILREEPLTSKVSHHPSILLINPENGIIDSSYSSIDDINDDNGEDDIDDESGLEEDGEDCFYEEQMTVSNHQMETTATDNTLESNSLLQAALRGLLYPDEVFPADDQSISVNIHHMVNDLLTAIELNPNNEIVAARLGQLYRIYLQDLQGACYWLDRSIEMSRHRWARPRWEAALVAIADNNHTLFLEHIQAIAADCVFQWRGESIKDCITFYSSIAGEILATISQVCWTAYPACSYYTLSVRAMLSIALKAVNTPLYSKLQSSSSSCESSLQDVEINSALSKAYYILGDILFRQFISSIEGTSFSVSLMQLCNTLTGLLEHCSPVVANQSIRQIQMTQHKGYLTGAITCLQQASKQSSSGYVNVNALDRLGKLMYIQTCDSLNYEDLESSLECFQQLVHLRPTECIHYMNLSFLYVQRKQINEAVNTLQQCLQCCQLLPEDRQILLNRIQTYTDNN